MNNLLILKEENKNNEEFDPGLELTLAVRLKHASQTECSNTFSGERVSNAWIIYL